MCCWSCCTTLLLHPYHLTSISLWVAATKLPLFPFLFIFLAQVGNALLVIILLLLPILELVPLSFFCFRSVLVGMAGRRIKNVVLAAVMVIMMFLCVFVSAEYSQLLSVEEKALMEIKASFGNAADEILDWTVDGRNSSTGGGGGGGEKHHEQQHYHCAWRGVFCDNVTFSVVSLNLSNMNLAGEISPAIRDLTNLQYIDLKANHLTGHIPDEIGDFLSLKYLDLSENTLVGDIPNSVSKLKQLEEFNLKENQLTGSIPSALSQIPKLRTLDLAMNQLTGEIPTSIYWNDALQYLGLRGNSLNGTLSPDMCQLTGLWYFDVRGNNITGNIPDSIGNCTSFEILDISYNEITGEIPFNIGFLQVATLSLQGNRLIGNIPEVIGLMQALAIVDLSENELVGSIPPILGNLSYTGKLYLHGNKLTGTIPPELGNMTKLSYLQLNNNQLEGSIPGELGNLEELFELNLANNKLEGPIPYNISSCTALNQFNVHGNQLNGSIPLDFQNLESLTYMNLSSNCFSGSIPIELGMIINLDTLDLSDNTFSGSVPNSIGDLEHLLQLNLSRNNLSDPLPVELGNLRSIQIIDISYNSISGSIPEELGQLQNLDSLLLNNNNLHGIVPDQLANCFSLTNLNLSYNDLFGEIPHSKNFSRFPASSFLGNRLLHGKCFGSPSGGNHRPNVKIAKVAVICITLSCVAILSVVILVIYISSNRSSKPFVKEPLKPAHGQPKLVVLQMGMAVYTYDDIMRFTENLSEKYIIGYGASGTVYKCVLKNAKSVAIKRLYKFEDQDQNVQEFETELATIGSIRHRNLVSLHAYSLSPHGNLLFYDYLENGSLWDLLHDSPKKVKLDWDMRLRIAVGAAQGLAYLHHDCNPRIIHRDVKSSNILLDENFEAHLSDFGIAKCIPRTKSHVSTYVLGTIGYIDPEYARTSRLTEKSDVYSFGIVLLELLTGKKAVDNESTNLHQLIMSKADDNTVMESVDSEVEVTCTDHALIRKAFQLALLCTKKHPLDRPNMHEVSHVLMSLLPVHSLKITQQQPLSLSPPSTKVVDYSRYVIQSETKKSGCTECSSSNSSDAQWFVKFGEVISKNSI